VVEILEPEIMLPQVAQGALAVECLVSDDAIRNLLAMIEHAPSRLAVDAERAFLDELGGDCNLPAGAFATVDASMMTIEGLLASFDGQTVIRDRRVVDVADGTATGRSIARHLLDDLGGSALLDR
jgi:hydroxymethylbilane synthase